MSTILYTLALNPLLHLLDRHLEGLSLGAIKQDTSLVAYVDCVTIISDKPDTLKVTEIINMYIDQQDAQNSCDYTLFSLYALHVSDCISPSSGATL